MNIKEIIHKSQHVQRNWDLSKEIPQEHLDILIEAATQCPSKQNIAYYGVHVITDRTLIEEIHSHTTGFGPNVFNLEEKSLETNTQVLANVLFCFTFHEASRLQTKRFLQQANGLTDLTINKFIEEQDRNTAIGIASGYVNFISNLLGYSTGFCGCFETEEIHTILTEEPILLLGIGFPDENKTRLEHHTDPTVKYAALRKEPIPVIKK